MSVKDGNRKAVLVLLMAVLMIGISGCTTANTAKEKSAAESEAEYMSITQEEARELMESEEGYLILDVRTPEEYEEGHVPGAICIANETIGSEPPAELTDKEQLLMVYCRSGNRSKQAAQKLAELGFTNVKEFGGIIDWTGDIEK